MASNTPLYSQWIRWPHACDSLTIRQETDQPGGGKSVVHSLHSRLKQDEAQPNHTDKVTHTVTRNKDSRNLENRRCADNHLIGFPK